MMDDETTGPDGRRIVPHRCRDENGNPLYEFNGAPGLGYFVAAPEHGRYHPTAGGARCWYYVPPNRPARPVWWNNATDPPPLPRRGTRPTGDKCGACGQPYWREFAGMADGECGYCYYNG